MPSPTAYAIRIDSSRPSGKIKSMFIAVTVGYLIAVIFATCGAVSTAIFLTELSQQTSRQDFVLGLATAATPLAIASIVFLLAQILVILQRNNVLLNHIQQPTIPQPKAPTPTRRKKEEVQQTPENYFNTENYAEPVTQVYSPVAADTTTPKPADNKNRQPESQNFFRVD